jgi:hypothetical protein
MGCTARTVENRLQVGGDRTQGTSSKNGCAANREVEKRRRRREEGRGVHEGRFPKFENRRLDDIQPSAHRAIYLHDILLYYMFYLYRKVASCTLKHLLRAREKRRLGNRE